MITLVNPSGLYVTVTVFGSGLGSPARTIRVALIVQVDPVASVAVQSLAVTNGLPPSSKSPRSVSMIVPPTRFGESIEPVLVTIMV